MQCRAIPAVIGFTHYLLLYGIIRCVQYGITILPSRIGTSSFEVKYGNIHLCTDDHLRNLSTQLAQPAAPIMLELCTSDPVVWLSHLASSLIRYVQPVAKRNPNLATSPCMLLLTAHAQAPVTPHALSVHGRRSLVIVVVVRKVLLHTLQELCLRTRGAAAVARTHAAWQASVAARR